MDAASKGPGQSVRFSELGQTQPQAQQRTPSSTTFTPPPVEDEAELRHQWAKSQIEDINSNTQSEIESLDELRLQQKELYQRQIEEKSAIWERLVSQRKDEAAELRSMIANLTYAISSARNEAKSEIDEAKRQAAQKTERMREQHKQQLQEIGELRKTLAIERKQFDFDWSRMKTTSSGNMEEKKEQIARLQDVLEGLKSKLAEKEAHNENRFRQQLKTIRELREQLQQARDEENAKQSDLMEMRKQCASLSKRISARKDEAASLKRQMTMLTRDNEELQNEIAKLGKGSSKQ